MNYFKDIAIGETFWDPHLGEFLVKVDEDKARPAFPEDANDALRVEYLWSLDVVGNNNP